MSKKPSAETQLKTVKHRCGVLETSLFRSESDKMRVERELSAMRQRFQECDAERRMLLKAVCDGRIVTPLQPAGG